MNIIVLIKQVVDVELNIRVKEGAIVEDGLTYVVGNWDEIAIEAALRFVEAVEGEVTLVTVGPERAAEALKKGLAMGAHKAIHILDAAFDGSDSYAYAKALSQVLAKQKYDLILGGKQAQDTDAGLTVSMLAEFLGLPQVTNVVKVEKVEAQQLTVHRKGDHGNEVIELHLPGVMTVNDSLHEPRLASLKGIMQAKKKPLEVMSLAATGINAAEIGKQGSPTTVVSFQEPQGRQAGQKFQGAEEETTQQVFNLLLNQAKIFA